MQPVPLPACVLFRRVAVSGTISKTPMFEHRRQPLVSTRIFYERLLRSCGVAGIIIVVSLVCGMAGYHLFEGMSWLDAFVNAAMILSGMGPVSQLQTAPGKIFAGCYALFSGLAFITAIGVVFAPIFHRFIHRFHLEADKTQANK